MIRVVQEGNVMRHGSWYGFTSLAVFLFLEQHRKPHPGLEARAWHQARIAYLHLKLRCLESRAVVPNRDFPGPTPSLGLLFLLECFILGNQMRKALAIIGA